MPAVKAEEKYKTVIYLPRDIKRRLWQERVDASTPVTTQITNIVREHFNRKDKDRKAKLASRVAS